MSLGCGDGLPAFASPAACTTNCASSAGSKSLVGMNCCPLTRITRGESILASDEFGIGPASARAVAAVPAPKADLAHVHVIQLETVEHKGDATRRDLAAPVRRR